MKPLRQFGAEKAIWGTCAGAIFLSKDVRRDQPLLELMDITVQRNAFGRQVDSFEIDLDLTPPGGVWQRVETFSCGVYPCSVDRIGGWRGANFANPARWRHMSLPGKDGC